MRPYRWKILHHDGRCQMCRGAAASGHPLCQADGCDRPATSQWARHATDAEFDTLDDAYRPVDGHCTKTVFGCDLHTLGPIDCRHDIGPIDCPTCGAPGDQPCCNEDGSEHGEGWHLARRQEQPSPSQCRHAHRPDCGGPGACPCTADDPVPQRPTFERAAIPAPPPGVPQIRVPVIGPLADLVAEHGIDLDRVAVSPGQPGLTVVPHAGGVAIRAQMLTRRPDGSVTLDEHGKPLLEVVTIPISLPAPAAPANIDETPLTLDVTRAERR